MFLINVFETIKISIGSIILYEYTLILFMALLDDRNIYVKYLVTVGLLIIHVSTRHLIIIHYLLIPINDICANI